MPTLFPWYPFTFTDLIDALEFSMINTTFSPERLINASLGTMRLLLLPPVGRLTLASIPSIREREFPTLTFIGNVLVGISPRGTIAKTFPWVSPPPAFTWMSIPIRINLRIFSGTSTRISTTSSLATVATGEPDESHSPRSTCFLTTIPSKGDRTLFFSSSILSRSTSAIREAALFSRPFTLNRCSSKTCSGIT